MEAITESRNDELISAENHALIRIRHAFPLSLLLCLNFASEVTEKFIGFITCAGVVRGDSGEELRPILSLAQ